MAGLTNFPNGISSFGIPVLGVASIPFTGKYIWCDPYRGSDAYNGTKDRPVATLYKAHSLMRDGYNDVCFLVGSPIAASASTGTARLSLALAQSIDSTATVGTLLWTKSACHLIGIAAPTSISQRARIAPVTTGSRATIFNSGNFVTVSGQGCFFANFDAFCGFATGGTSQIAWTDSGGRNCYQNVNIQGKGDAASAADTASRSLLVSGSVGENTFINCTIGLDTIKGVDAATEIQFSGGSPRNRFENCVIEACAGGTSSTWVSIGASGIDRYVLFRNCMFTNPVLPASGVAASQMTVGMSINAAAGGTVQVMNSMYYGAATMSTSALVFSNIAAGAAKGGLGVVAS